LETWKQISAKGLCEADESPSNVGRLLVACAETEANAAFALARVIAALSKLDSSRGRLAFGLQELAEARPAFGEGSMRVLGGRMRARGGSRRASCEHKRACGLSTEDHLNRSHARGRLDTRRTRAKTRRWSFSARASTLAAARDETSPRLHSLETNVPSGETTFRSMSADFAKSLRALGESRDELRFRAAKLCERRRAFCKLRRCLLLRVLEGADS
jgi:hypothetical protein